MENLTGNELIVVYKEKDEIAVNQLRKLIESNGEAVPVVRWTEQFWLEQKREGIIDSKMLFVGKVKGTEELFPIIDIKYKRHGILYGWAGNQAILYVNDKFINSEEAYQRFLSNFKRKIEGEITKKQKKIGVNVSTAVKFAGTLVAPWVWPVFGASLLNDVFKDKRLVRDQQLIYGVTELYHKHLAEFMGN